MTTFHIRDLKDWDAEKEAYEGYWVSERPENYKYRTLWERITEAWGVFTGRLDSVFWGFFNEED